MSRRLSIWDGDDMMIGRFASSDGGRIRAGRLTTWDGNVMVVRR